MTLCATAITVTAGELAVMVVDGLNLEGINPADIDPSAPLFGEGLGLDSLDMLEIALIIQQKYGVKLRADDPGNEAIFTSMESLSLHISHMLAVR